MKKLLLMAAAMTLFASPVLAAAEIGQPAPEIEGTDVLTGQPFKLSDHKGKVVVLEWTNNQCPFVVKHYGSGNMQKVQKEAEAQGAEWITINSAAPGLQGHVTAEESKKILADAGATPTANILDESGAIGTAYGAKTTPHMYVINAEGTLVYAGAIDDNSSADPKTIEGAKNYVLAALSDINAGNPVGTPSTEAYGCGVKYAK